MPAPRRTLCLAALVLFVVPTMASAHFHYRLTSHFRDRVSLQQTVNALTFGHVDIDDMAVTPQGEWLVVAGTEVFHSRGFPSAPLAKVREFLDAGRTIDAVAFTPGSAWAVVAGDLHALTGPIRRKDELDRVLTRWLAQGRRVTDLVFDADNNGWSVVAGNAAWTRNMPRAFFDAVIERHRGRRTIRQMEMAYDGRWIVIADQWYASDGLSELQLNRLGRFQRARLGLDNLLLGRKNDFILFSRGGVVPDLSSPMQRMEYDLAGRRKNLWQRMAEEKVPGLSVAVISGNRVEWARGYGTLEAGTQRWVRASSPFDAASVSKFMGAMTISALADDGVVDLEEDISTYMGRGTALEEWEQVVGPLFGETTLTHLLSHTAGLLPHGSTRFRLDSEIPGTLDLLLGAHYCPDRNCQYRKRNRVRPTGEIPGTSYRYSGGGFLVAEAVAEAATGRSFDELIVEKLFDPLGMEDTGLANPLPSQLRARSASPHGPGGERIGERNYPWTAAGGIFASPSDVGQALAILLNRGRTRDGQVILSEEAVQRTLQDHVPGTRRYGLGVDLVSPIVDDTGGSFRHSGVHLGARAWFLANPSRDQAFVVMINARTRTEALIFELLNALRCAYGWTSC